MNSKYLFIVSLILLSVLTLSAVSANDNITSDEVKITSPDTDDILTDNSTGTFNDLSSQIKKTPEGSTLILKQNYKNTDLNKGISITKSMTIDGNGHTIDANKKTRIFTIKASDVVLKNIIFKNGYSTNGGAISFEKVDNYETSSNCVVDNCTFIDCRAEKSGAIHLTEGYMFSDGGHGFKDGCSNCVINNSNFINCHANTGGAISFYDDENTGSISNCNFINCSAANEGGAIYFYHYFEEYDGGYYTYHYFNGRGTISNCSFFTCNAEYGGAIYIGRDWNTYDTNYLDFYNSIRNSTVKDCNFMNCYSNMGGSIYWDCISGKVINSNFTNSSAEIGGAIYANYNIDLLIEACYFKGDTANDGNAVYGGIVYNCSLTENKNPATSNPYNPQFSSDNDGITGHLSMRLQNAIGNLSLYLAHEEGDYFLIKCVNFTCGIAEVNFNFPKLGRYSIKTIADTNYGTFESYTNSTVTCLELEGVDYQTEGPYYGYPSDFGPYVVNANLPDGSEGNLTLYISSDGENYELYGIINLSNSTEIKFSPANAGKYWINVVYSGIYGFENKSTVIRFIELKDESEIKASNANIFYNDKGKYSAEIYDFQGYAPYDGTKVTIKIANIEVNAKIIEGVAKTNIPKLKPGTYKITIKYKARYKTLTVSKKLTVKHLVNLKSIKVKKSSKQITLQATLKNKKAIKGKTVTFKFNGKTYKAKTDKKGIAKVTIKSSILKKLKLGKKITYQATYLKDTVKKTVKVQK